MKRRDPIDRQQNRAVLWALGLSIAIHALLLLLTQLFPMGSMIPAAVLPVEPTVLRFTFDRPESEPTTDDPLQDSRFLPIEPEQPAEPDLPLPEPEIAPEPVPVQPPQPESIPESVEELGEQRSAPVPSAVDPDAAIRSAEPEESFSMDRAFREFGEARERVPRPSPGPPRSQGLNNNVVQPDFSQVPSVGFGMGNLTFESRDYDWSDYGRQVYMAIWRAWHNRLYVTYDEFEKWAARTGVWRLNHRTRVHFVIERNGAVTGVTLDDGSTCRPFDDSAIEALEEVILPPLPADFPRDREVVHARFIGQGPIRAMPINLRRLKRAGYF